MKYPPVPFQHGVKPVDIPSLYQRITAQIVAEMEAGRIPWACPWDKAKAAAMTGIPQNAKTGRPYSGVNVLTLWAEAFVKEYPTHNWLTFQQARELNAYVRKGEKSTPAVFTKMVDVEVEENGEKKTDQRPVLRMYHLFNVAQLDNLPSVYATPPQLAPEQTRYDNMLGFVAKCGVKVEYGGSRACYMPNRDLVMMPPYGSFATDEGFFGVLGHELVHATGAPHRLDRKLNNRFGETAYAREELIAEIGSAFLCAEHGIPPTTRANAAYVQNWVKVLNDDHRAIFHAASQASMASRFLLEEANHAVQADTPECERGEEIAV